jgi:hypothetical protein
LISSSLALKLTLRSYSDPNSAGRQYQDGNMRLASVVNLDVAHQQLKVAVATELSEVEASTLIKSSVPSQIFIA